MAHRALLEERASVAHQERTPRLGLCRDCMQAAECTFPRDPAQPVRECEEFAPAPSVVRRGAPLVTVERIFSATQEPGDGTGEPRGLCLQCRNRMTCTFPKPPGGVWQCDELA